MMNLIPNLYDNFFVLIKTDNRSIQHDLYTGFIGLVEKLLSYDKASDLRPVFLLAKKLMNLFK